MWRNAEQGSESKRCSHVYAQTINTIYSEYPECRRGVHCLLWTVLGHTTYAPDKLGQRRTKYCSAGMAAHLIADTACLPSLTSCSCVHNHVRPAAQTQRLAQRKSGAFSSQQSCHLPRRRTGRNTSRVCFFCRHQTAVIRARMHTAKSLPVAAPQLILHLLCRFLLGLHKDKGRGHRSSFLKAMSGVLPKSDTRSMHHLPCMQVTCAGCILSCSGNNTYFLCFRYETMIVLRPDMNDENR